MAIYTIDRIEKKTVGTTATDLNVDYAAVFIENLTADNILYFKEKSKDNANATANNSFALPGGQKMDFPVRAKTLSLIASAASTDVRIMYVKEEC